MIYKALYIFTGLLFFFSRKNYKFLDEGNTKPNMCCPSIFIFGGIKDELETGSYG